MAAASGCSLEIDAAAVPLLDGARELVSGNVPGGGRTNRQHFGARITIDASVDPADRSTCCSIPRRPAGCWSRSIAGAAEARSRRCGRPASRRSRSAEVHDGGGSLIRVR